MEITNENQSAGGAGESSVNSDDMWSTGTFRGTIVDQQPIVVTGKRWELWDVVGVRAE